MKFYYGSGEFRKISFKKDPHCELLEERLKRIEVRFMFQDISESCKIKREIPEIKFCLSREIRESSFSSGMHHDFTKKFTQSLSKIGEWTYILAEREFFVNNALYSKFKSSPFYQELKREISTLFSGQYTWPGGKQVSFSVEELLNMTIQQPSADYENRFYMKFSQYGFDSLIWTDYEYVYELLGSPGYRSLDHTESSMLAIALSEDFPERFNLRFRCYLERRSIALILYPEFVPFPAPQKVTSAGPRDLY